MSQTIQRPADPDTVDGNVRVVVCQGTGCVSSGSDEVYDALDEAIDALDDSEDVVLSYGDGDLDELGIETKKSGCHGFCELGPLVRIDPMHVLYTQVGVEDVDDIVERTVKNGEVIDELCFEDPDGNRQSRTDDISFYTEQNRLALGNCGDIDPESVEEYRLRDGYDALEKALTEMDPQDVYGEVEEAGLRGRGGGGFPTGTKWKFANDADADEKYVIANCDEGDPGAFMDRCLVEGDPHRVIEGMAIAGYATGANQGYIYIRAEYPLAIERIEQAIDTAYKEGYLGEDIFGTGFDFDFGIEKGAGAFVCGEETALMASIEGQAGRPTPRPPYPAQSGLNDQPTTINNVETLSNVPLIIDNGAKWFRQYGTEDSAGTKTFAVSGDVSATGLMEIPMGLTLEEIIEVAGGMEGDSEFKAVQIGGPSGGCLAEKHLDMPVTFDSLQEEGAMLGSGGLVVMDDETCMVDVARFFLDFTQDESCGKCPTCRIGTKKMLDILERITNGEGEPGDIERLRDLGETITEGSLCGLGQTAPNPVLSTLEHFEEEYEAHIYDDECPAGECELGDGSHAGTYKIAAAECVGCQQCLSACPVDAIDGEQGETHEIDPETCIGCGQCVEACPIDAISERV
ncbi:NADH:ubiquinone oxidoreductase, NADH-binding 51 kD subunit (chain F) [Halapricum desulfuricans]|uniref:NADH:ubiquinone oxidoreductase, NADH-binding 51 kD subunit (Chain F) n=1 Tax=Halapricum desulfuricans TaxID=2841257 RepID=A0A897ND14_9EURY|nr:NADH-ubiquinone oxidoreductase-F iron-sulfur binding region domain-containing protein [Halapricum desulfuricans]QSG10587.1 NADH:ubiquinone oxidoreductase, NADH-binding 51 kD subunit (chain F) [Halapricum desulfuricans]